MSTSYLLLFRLNQDTGLSRDEKKQTPKGHDDEGLDVIKSCPLLPRPTLPTVPGPCQPCSCHPPQTKTCLPSPHRDACLRGPLALTPPRLVEIVPCIVPPIQSSPRGGDNPRIEPHIAGQGHRCSVELRDTPMRGRRPWQNEGVAGPLRWSRHSLLIGGTSA